MMKSVISFFLFVIAVSGLNSSSTAVPVSAPNIILIVADDLGYGDVGAYGAELIKTPHLDRLAAEGIRLRNFYASGNVCTPSRAGLLTGRYAIRDGLANKTITVNDQRGLPEGATTIAGLLQQHGYRTALIGKWHLGHHTKAQQPNAQGFGEFYGLLHPNDTEQPIYRNTLTTGELFEQSDLTRRFTEEAVRYIEADTEQPFFLFLSHTAPHIPLVPSPAFAGTSRAGAYGDVVEELDWSIGQVLEAVQRNQHAGNTVIIFTSDNGPFPEGSTGGLRGGKGTAWDGGFRVPFIARWPGRIPASTTSDAMSMNIDLLPTLAEAAGVPLSRFGQLDGRNIMPVLLGDTDKSPHEALFFFNNERIAALRTQRWRMVLSDYPPWRDAKPVLFEATRMREILLFDLSRDPGEQYDMSRDHSDAKQHLLEHLERGRKTLEVLSSHTDGEMYEGLDKN